MNYWNKKRKINFLKFNVNFSQIKSIGNKIEVNKINLINNNHTEKLSKYKFKKAELKRKIEEFNLNLYSKEYNKKFLERFIINLKEVNIEIENKINDLIENCINKKKSLDLKTSIEKANQESVVNDTLHEKCYRLPQRVEGLKEILNRKHSPQNKEIKGRRLIKKENEGNIKFFWKL